MEKITMDLSTYPDQKEKGNVSVGKVGMAYVISSRRFDPTNGQEVQPEVAALAMADIDRNLAEFQAKIDALTMLKDDLVALG